MKISRPVVAIGRGGSGTRLLSLALQEHGIFLGNQLNESHDSTEWVDLIYKLAIEKLTNKLPSSPIWQQLTLRAESILGIHGDDPSVGPVEVPVFGLALFLVYFLYVFSFVRHGGAQPADRLLPIGPNLRVFHGRTDVFALHGCPNGGGHDQQMPGGL